MILANILLFLNVFVRNHKLQKKDRGLDSYLKGTVIWAVLLYGYTEILSSFHGIRLHSLLLVWGISNLLLLVMLITYCKRQRIDVQQIKETLVSHWQQWWKKRYCLFVIIYAVVVILALYTVPYNWDSMTYHLPRIMHWVQNGSVGHYATNSIRQIASPVFGEFVNLHVYILCGNSDALFLLLQCFSYITCSVIVYHIAAKIKCNQMFCYISTLLYLSMPIAFAEALTTQVDHLATMWLLIFTYELLDVVDEEKKLTWDRATISKVCFLGLCVGLGYLTKPSVCIAMAVLVLWVLSVSIARKDSVICVIKLIACVVPCMLVMVIPEMVRNLMTFQAISAPIAGQRQLVGTVNPLYLCINFIKNFIYNLPTTLFYDLNTLLTSILNRVSAMLNVPLNDPAISEDGGMFYLHSAPNYGHDTAANPAVLWLFIVCLLWALICRVRSKGKGLQRWHSAYSFWVSAAFLIFCVVLRWEPYVTRYMLSFLALLCPMIGFQLQHLTESEKVAKLRYALVGVIVFVCITDVISMGIYHRNLCVRFGAAERPYGYFTNRTDIVEQYSTLSRMIKEAGYTSIGIKLGGNDYEYPLWVLLEDVLAEGGSLRHIGMENESAIYEDKSFVPECIIWKGTLAEEGFAYNGAQYETKQSLEGGFVLLVRVV